MKLKKKIKLIIAADGGAASGKTTGARKISKKYGLKFLSSGLLYRFASYQILKFKPRNRLSFLKKSFKKLSLKKLEKLNLHSPKISEHTSVIAKEKKIREILKNYQKRFAKKFNKVCIEGRDIGTVILPNADIKFFFKCDLATAAIRRFSELKKTNCNWLNFKIFFPIMGRSRKDPYLPHGGNLCRLARAGGKSTYDNSKMY